MRVVRAEALGFCFGVRCAVERVEEELSRGPLCTLGSVVHNARVVESLAQRGATPVHSLDEVPAGGTVAITAHGAEREVVLEAVRRGLRVVDTTCPIVRRAQEVAESLAQDGRFLVVYGEADHPEVRGILSFAGGCGVAALDPAEPLPEAERYGLVAQTTQGEERFAAFSRALAARLGERLQVVDTTCRETTHRYEAVGDLARGAQALVVVGSKTSANTRRLADACRATGLPTHEVEGASDVDPSWFKGVTRCGVTAGTSASDAQIAEVVLRLRTLGATEPDRHP